MCVHSVTTCVCVCVWESLFFFLLGFVCISSCVPACAKSSCAITLCSGFSLPLWNCAPCSSVCTSVCQNLLTGSLSQSGQVLGHLGKSCQIFELVKPGCQGKKYSGKFPSCPWRKIYSLTPPTPQLQARSEHTLWREAIKNQYFTAYTEGYYSAAARDMDHYNTLLHLLVYSLHGNVGLDPKF